MTIAATGNATASSYMLSTNGSRPASASATNGSSSNISQFLQENQSTAAATSSRSLSGYAPAVQLSPTQLASLQSDLIQSPDPVKTAAQNNDRAFALITDTKTGKVVGGVWPHAAIASGPDIAYDSRLGSDANMSEVTQYLAQDIEKATGDAVTIQYFKPNDPNAPTFGAASQQNLIS